jgi:hypothetical protein
VQVGARLQQQLLVRDLAHQQVRETNSAPRESVSRSRSSSSGPARRDPRAGPLRRRDRFQQREREVGADDRSELQRALHRLGQPVDARGQQVVDRGRDLGVGGLHTLRLEEAHQLLGEERIAAGARNDELWNSAGVAAIAEEGCRIERTSSSGSGSSARRWWKLRSCHGAE